MIPISKFPGFFLNLEENGANIGGGALQLYLLWQSICVLIFTHNFTQNAYGCKKKVKSLVKN